LSGSAPTSAGVGGSVPSPTLPRFTQPLPRAVRRTPDVGDPQTSTSTVPERPLERRRSAVPMRSVPPVPSASAVPNDGANEVRRYRPAEEPLRRAPSAVRRDAPPAAARPPAPQSQNREPERSLLERPRGEPRAAQPAAAPGQGASRGGESSGAGARRRGGSERGSVENGRSSGGARRRSP
jgi:hypothetical protein